MKREEPGARGAAAAFLAPKHNLPSGDPLRVAFQNGGSLKELDAPFKQTPHYEHGYNTLGCNFTSFCLRKASNHVQGFFFSKLLNYNNI